MLFPRLNSEAKPRAELKLETLEDRAVPAALASLLGDGTLSITGDSENDSIVVRQIDGQISIDGSTIDVGGTPEASVSAGLVARIEVAALDGNDFVDLDSGAVAGQQPLLVAAVVDGGLGEDELRGLAGFHQLKGSVGNDILHVSVNLAYLLGNPDQHTIDYGQSSDMSEQGSDTVHLRLDMSSVGTILPAYLSRLKYATRPFVPIAELLERQVPLVSHFTNYTFADMIKDHGKGGDTFTSFAKSVLGINGLSLTADGLEGFVDLGSVRLDPGITDPILTTLTQPSIPEFEFVADLEALGIQLPLLTDPRESVNLLLNLDASLFEFELPELKSSFKFDDAYPVFVVLRVGVKAELSFTANLTVGYDTRGFRTGELLGGVYLTHTENEEGVPLPILGIGGIISAYLAAGIPDLAEAGFRGSILSKVDFVLEGNGKVRLDELEDFPFVRTGNISGTLSVYYETPIDDDEEILAEVHFFDFGTESGSPGGPPPNRPPSFVKGPDQIVEVNSGTTTVPQWATQISPGPAGEEDQLVSFKIEYNSNPELFLIQPTVEIDGTLSYTIKPGAIGAAVLMVRAKDDGGKANGGDDTSDLETFVITVTDGRRVASTGDEVAVVDAAPGLPKWFPIKPAIASDGEGNYVVVWAQGLEGPLPRGGDIYAQLFSADGTPRTEPFQVNSYGNLGYFYSNSPTVTMNADGAFVVTWPTIEDSYYLVKARLFAPNGTPVTDEFRVDTGRTSVRGELTHGTDPVTAMDAFGGFVVAYTNGLGEVAVRRFDPSGNELGNTVWAHFNDDVPANFSAPAYAPSIATNAAGDFVVAWSYQSTTHSASADVQARYFRADGVNVGGLIDVHAMEGAERISWQPSVALDADGDFVIAWTSNEDANGVVGSYRVIWAQRYAAGGLAKGDRFVVNEGIDTYRYVESPTVALDADGDFAIAWSDSGQFTTGIYLRRFLIDGTPRGRVERVGERSDFYPAIHPHLSLDADGEFSVAWFYGESSTLPAELMVRRYRFDEPPTNLILDTSSVAENSPIGTVVGTFETTDAVSPPQTFAYELVDGLGSDDNALFEIVDGQLRTAAAFDFETRSTYSIRVRVTDEGGLTLTKQLSIAVTDVDETPPSLSIAPLDAVKAERNLGPTAFTFTVTRTGNTGGVTAVEYEVVGSGPNAAAPGDFVGGAFPSGTIEFAAGELSRTITIEVLGDAAFETDEGFEVRLASPSGGATLEPGASEAAATILNDDAAPNSPPVAVANAYGTVAGRTFAVAAPGLLANDTDADGDSLMVFAPESIVLTGGQGALQVREDGSFTFMPAPGFVGTATFNYATTDGIDVSAIATVSINVTAAPEPPPQNPGTPSGPGSPGEETPEPPPSPGQVVPITAVAGSSGTVTVFNPDGSPSYSLTPFANAPQNIRVALADVSGDGIPDTIVGTGPGVATSVRIYDGRTREVIFEVAPFEPSFTGGIYVSAGDLTGDGVAELVISPDEGGGPRVRVFNGSSFSLLDDFNGIDDPNFRGGARTTIADFDGDGIADLIVAAGFGGGPRVAIFEGRSVLSGAPIRLTDDFFVFEPTLRNGAFIAAGDIDADGKADLVAGGGPGGGPRVTIYSGDALLSGQRVVLSNFFAGNPDNRGGVRVAVKDLDGDEFGDLIVGDGSGAGSRVTGYSGRDLLSSAPPLPLIEYDAFPGTLGGVFVG